MLRFHSILVSPLAFVGILSCGPSDAVEKAVPTSAVLIKEPHIEIGDNDELMRPAGATRLTTGTIVILDSYAQAILFFDSAAKLIRSVGRKGSGPGEYQDPAWLGVCEPDSLFVFDPRLGRITVLDTAGIVVRQFIAPRASRLSCHNGTIAALMMPEGIRRPEPNKPRERYAAQIQLLDTNGDLKASTETVSVGEFGPLAKVAGIALTDDRLWYGSADSAYLELFTHKARRVGGVAVHLPLRRATEHYRSSDIEEQVMRFTDKATRETSRRILNQFSVPSFLPAFKQLVPDPQGNVWLTTSFAGDSVTYLRVITKTGDILADITLSKRIHVFEIGHDYILGFYESDGQPRVLMYSFDPAILRQMK